MITTSAFAQKDVTLFMGIPVDGSKSEMIRKLKAKGFRSTTNPYTLSGRFNGSDVKLHVVDENDKVYRIVVEHDPTRDVRNTIIKFNNLCSQFEKNAKYTSIQDCRIPDDEDISYEMTVHNKRYEAVYYQNPVITDSIALKQNILSSIGNRYPNKEIKDLNEDELKSFILEYTAEYFSKKPVWFMISGEYGLYSIIMFYDNEYNRANGEDL